MTGEKPTQVLCTKINNYYFPHSSIDDLSEGIPWQLKRLQGENKMFYTSAFTCFDLTQAIMHYNMALLDKYDFDNICGSLIYDGMNRHDVSMNIAILKQVNHNSRLFIESSIIDQNKVIDSLNNWQDHITYADNYGAITKLTNIYNNQHAVLLQAMKIDVKIAVILIDPLSQDYSEFIPQMDNLLQYISSQKSVNKVDILYSGKQDHEYETCADMSLIMLQDLIEDLSHNKQDKNGKDQGEINGLFSLTEDDIEKIDFNIMQPATDKTEVVWQDGKISTNDDLILIKKLSSNILKINL